MCRGKAFIVRKGQRHPDYVMNSNDHLPLVEKFNLSDNDPPELKKFIRIEMLPTGELTSTNPKDWEFHVDETNSLPSWFENKREDWGYKCKKILTEKIVPSWIKNSVGGSLYLGGTKVTSLGKLTSVGGSLICEEPTSQSHSTQTYGCG